MQQLTEIRWHARAGQGAVTASRLVAETAMDDGQYMQAMPEYGAERQGAPLKAYTRISPDPIEIHNNILNPDIVVVLDDTLLEVIDVCEGIRPDGNLVVNTRMSPDEVRALVSGPDTIKINVVDASNIAVSEIGRDIPNTPIAGALAKVTGVIDVNSLKKYVEKSFSEKFSEKVVAGNLASIDRAYEEVR
jgi:pyruvate ferredoxin oxidoreductase gamma subunit